MFKNTAVKYSFMSLLMILMLFMGAGCSETKEEEASSGMDYGGTVIAQGKNFTVTEEELQKSLDFFKFAYSYQTGGELYVDMEEEVRGSLLKSRIDVKSMYYYATGEKGFTVEDEKIEEMIKANVQNSKTQDGDYFEKMLEFRGMSEEEYIDYMLTDKMSIMTVIVNAFIEQEKSEYEKTEDPDTWEDYYNSLVKEVTAKEEVKEIEAPEDADSSGQPEQSVQSE